MNKLTSVLCFFICSIYYSQAPQKINYQALVRDANGNIIPNTSVPITISVVDGINTCSVYNGNQTTNSYGLISLELDLSACTIDWSTGTATLSSSINSVSGISNLNSVPYSLHATTVANYPSAGNSDGDILVWSASSGEWIAQSSSSTNGINCWDTNGDGVNDSSEDTNNDGAWNALDCAGADGADGNDGADGTDGTNGINCWDTNGDGVNDSSEDTNNDGAWNALDCAGADGADGQDGTQGSVGAVMYIYNGQTCPAGWNTQQINVAIFGGAAVDACYTDSPCVVMYIYDGQTCPAGWTTWPIGVAVLNGTNIPVDACFKCN